jgi:hypothetical protein
MAASHLEQVRLLHEELECLEQHMVETLEGKPEVVSL